MHPSTKILKNSKQPQKVAQPLQKKQSDKENYISDRKALLNVPVSRPVPVPIRPGQDEKAMLNAVYQSMAYADVTFIVEGQEFPAHRGILAARCRYFEKLLATSTLRLLLYFISNIKVKAIRYNSLTSQQKLSQVL